MAKCVHDVIQATNEHDRAENDLVAQTEMAWWAFWMAIVSGAALIITAVGIYFIRETLVETRKAVKAADDAVDVTQDVGQAQVRAYVACQSAKFAVDLDAFWCAVTLKNAGQSPAFDVEMTGSILCMHQSKGDDGRTEFSRVTSNITNGNAGTIEASSEGMLYLFWPHTDMERFEELSVHKRFSIAGRISWTDVFDKKWEKVVFLDESADSLSDFFFPGKAMREGTLKASNRSNIKHARED